MIKLTLNITIALICIFLCACSQLPDDSGTLTVNMPPKAELANIPPDDISGNNLLSPEVTFYWYGSDRDGYVKSYMYRWCLIKNYSDTVWTPWQEINAIDSDGNKLAGVQQVTLIIESPEEKNYHIFQVRATDDKGAVQSPPASVRFWTRKGSIPETVMSSNPGNEAIVMDKETDSWPGLIFKFSDQTSKYSFKIGNSNWSNWSDTNTIILTGMNFNQSGDYKIYFKARNKFGVEDDTPLEYDIKIIKPSYQKNVLLVDMTTDGIGLPGSPSDLDVDEFYKTIMNKNGINDFDLWDVKASGGFPPREVMAKYKMLLIYFDNSYSEPENKFFLKDILALENYLDTGGRMIISGWIATNLFYNSSQAQDFFYKYSQATPDNISTSPVTLNTNHPAGYPGLRFDQAKLPIEWNGKLANIQFFTPRAFCIELYTLNLPQNIYNGKMVISMLKTESYNTVLSTLPLYFFNVDDVSSLFTKIIEDFK